MLTNTVTNSILKFCSSPAQQQGTPQKIMLDPYSKNPVRLPNCLSMATKHVAPTTPTASLLAAFGTKHRGAGRFSEVGLPEREKLAMVIATICLATTVIELKNSWYNKWGMAAKY